MSEESRVRENHQAYAVVTVTLEVKADGVWGEGCTIGQVHKQAKDSVEGLLMNPQSAEGMAARKLVEIARRCRIKDMQVKAVITEEKR